MADTTLYSPSLLLPSDTLCNFIQTSSHLAATMASNNFYNQSNGFISSKCLANLPLCFSLMRFSLIELLGMHNWLPLNNIPSWIIKSNHFFLSSAIGSVQAFHASPKLGSSRYKVLGSLNPATSIYIYVSKRCLLLSAFETLLDFPLLCFKRNV